MEFKAYILKLEVPKENTLYASLNLEQGAGGLLFDSTRERGIRREGKLRTVELVDLMRRRLNP